MGANDVKEQLEAAIEENFRLEADNRRQADRIAAALALHSPETWYYHPDAEYSHKTMDELIEDVTLDLSKVWTDELLVDVTEQKMCACCYDAVEAVFAGEESVPFSPAVEWPCQTYRTLAGIETR